jgi:hypothetical protein
LVWARVVVTVAVGLIDGALQVKVDSDAGQEQSAGAGAVNELVEHGGEHKEQRLEVVDRGLEGEVLGERKGRLGGDKQVVFHAGGETVKAVALLAEARDEVGGPKCGQITGGA